MRTAVGADRVPVSRSDVVHPDVPRLPSCDELPSLRPALGRATPASIAVHGGGAQHGTEQQHSGRAAHAGDDGELLLVIERHRAVHAAQRGGRAALLTAAGRCAAAATRLAVTAVVARVHLLVRLALRQARHRLRLRLAHLGDRLVHLEGGRGHAHEHLCAEPLRDARRSGELGQHCLSTERAPSRRIGHAPEKPQRRLHHGAGGRAVEGKGVFCRHDRVE
mmetsp:Transcript_5764/g.14764  ORF Transcript_5764/g.14764 Transcript_5764/m.14764 type:complete len:221 (-) Transcript_5764:118-780(-)